VQDAASAAVTRLIPAELDIKGLYEDYDHRKRKSGNEKTVAPHVQVYDRYTPTHTKLTSQQASTCSESSLTAGVSRKEKAANSRARGEIY
jgi:hypothetical protein